MKKELERIARKFDLKLVILFGSRASGEATERSDYDIGLFAGHLLSEEEIIELQGIFSRLFQTDRVDLVDLKKAPPLLKVQVFKNFRVLYESDPMLKFQLPLSAEAEFEECRDLYEMRRQRLEEFVRET